MSVVWERHLLLKHGSRLSGKGDLMDTRQKRRGHFVSHSESGRKKTWAVAWLFFHIDWIRLLNLGSPRTIGTNPPGQDCYSQGHGAVTKS